ncbi:ABC transporter permease [Microlunatus parietis]|uniref:ABC-2 type transport system permease protein n=1 Tax=Microlunatus parietis TaxID=682979 RepID=A0A7Y9LDI8_9ACTN|nr:ABC-2 family transporter protein [Microlunatus parietis]NYE72840.1 ABC-2 type transport system permease protein [Microlunatus parietis]
MAELSLIDSYRTVVASRIRAQASYRLSFTVETFNSILVGIVEFAEIYVLLANVPQLGGLTLAQAALVFALANLGFSIADMIFGQLDSIPQYLRLGKLESFLVRPMPLMTQMITSDLQLRRLGRALVGLVILIIAWALLGLPMTPGTLYLLIITPITGAAIYGAMFTLAGGIQFYVIDGAEFTNAFVYGGGYAGQLPGSVLLMPVRVLFTFVIPATVTAYLPALLILGEPGPELLPSWLGWFAPLFAIWAWLLAGFAWRSGVRKFTGAGG